MEGLPRCFKIMVNGLFLNIYDHWKRFTLHHIHADEQRLRFNLGLSFLPKDTSTDRESLDRTTDLLVSGRPLYPPEPQPPPIKRDSSRLVERHFLSRFCDVSATESSVIPSEPGALSTRVLCFIETWYWIKCRWNHFHKFIYSGIRHASSVCLRACSPAKGIQKLLNDGQIKRDSVETPFNVRTRSGGVFK